MTSSRGSSQPKDCTWVSCIAGGFSTAEPLGKTPCKVLSFGHTIGSNPLRPHRLQHTMLACPSLSPEVCPSSMSIAPVIPPSHLILWCPLLLLPSILPSIRDFFPKYWLFTSGDQNTGTSTSASVLPMSIQGWFPLGLTGLISLLSRGLSRVFSSTTVQKHYLSCLGLWFILN